MSKIGSYDYPDFQFGTLLRAIEVLVSQFSGHINDEKTFAEALGHKSEKSGAFLSKMADLRRYGFIESRTKGINATQRARNIIKNLTPEERQGEINNAISNIGLWKDLYERLNNKRPSHDEFRIQLVEVTGDRNRSIRDAESIRNLYIDAMANYSEEVGKSVDESGYDDSFLTTKNNKLKGVKVPETLIMLKSGDIDITVPKTDNSIKFLVDLLNGMKANAGVENQDDENTENNDSASE